MNRPKFKSDVKKWLIDIINDYRTEKQATFSEIADDLNQRKVYTLYNKEWTTNYLIRFYGQNKERSK